MSQLEPTAQYNAKQALTSMKRCGRAGPDIHLKMLPLQKQCQRFIFNSDIIHLVFIEFLNTCTQDDLCRGCLLAAAQRVHHEHWYQPLV